MINLFIYIYSITTDKKKKLILWYVSYLASYQLHQWTKTKSIRFRQLLSKPHFLLDAPPDLLIFQFYPSSYKLPLSHHLSLVNVLPATRLLAVPTHSFSPSSSSSQWGFPRGSDCYRLRIYNTFDEKSC